MIIPGFRARLAKQEYERYGLTDEQWLRLRRLHFGDIPVGGEDQGLEKFPYDKIGPVIKETAVYFSQVYLQLIQVSRWPQWSITPST